MDAIGAHAPGPDEQFHQIVAGLDSAEIERAATAPEAPAHHPAHPPTTPPPAPAPNADQERTAGPAPTPAHAAVPVPVQIAPPAPLPQPRPRLPQAPTAPEYWGQRGLVAVYWIAILTGAIGQVIFFGDLFHLGWAGYLAATIIATTAETVMVSSGDTALDLRAKGRRKPQWVPFLLIAFAAAAAASGMNLTHWWAKNPSMAIIFGGIAFLGFLLHVVHGFGEGTEYLAEKKKYDKAIAELEAKQQAEIERARQQQARIEKEQELQRRKPEQPATPPPPTPRASSRTTPGPAKSRPAAKKPSGNKITREEVLAWALQQDELPNSGEVLHHFESTGRPLPTDRAVRNWLAEVKTTD
ncbi:hypothetical protein [Amycolatopsis sp. ATCC 39116]|uniref:hypothetical protein n=1 Tax=Amycolatopsis sp. (strain ATCC 39116 / 75iv2) TaxID=385957 RepID=UPI0002625913|nr:hypothetical protein [Amycolatopsis sp. ATCC 39116]